MGGWLLFGAAMMIGRLDVRPWAVVLATTPVYILLRLGQERAFVRVRDIVAIEAEGDGSTLRPAPHLARRPSAKSLRESSSASPTGSSCASTAPPS